MPNEMVVGSDENESDFARPTTKAGYPNEQSYALMSSVDSRS